VTVLAQFPYNHLYEERAILLGSEQNYTGTVTQYYAVSDN
jgi:hypothetical protein